MAGQTLLGSGGLLYLKDSNFTTKYHGGQHTLQKIPKAKHTYFVKFTVPVQATMALGIPAYKVFDLTFMLKSIDVPSVSYDTETVNQYNRKRVVQTQTSYDTLAMTFYDDKEGLAMGFMEDYHRYYYADTRVNFGAERVKWNNGTLLSVDNERDFGFKYKSVPFFEKMTIFRLDSKRYATVWDCHNPVFKSIKYDALDYSETSPSLINTVVEYEGYSMPYKYLPIKDIISDQVYTGLQPILDVVGENADFYDIDDPYEGVGSFLHGLSTDAIKDFATDGNLNGFTYLNDLAIEPIKEFGTSTLSSFGNFIFG